MMENEELTPVTFYPSINKTPNDRKQRNTLSRLIDYIMVGEGYLKTLSTEQILNRAIKTRTREEFTAVQSACEESYRDLFERANAFIERLGRNYRIRVQNQAISVVLHRDITPVDPKVMGL